MFLVSNLTHFIDPFSSQEAPLLTFVVRLEVKKAYILVPGLTDLLHDPDPGGKCEGVGDRDPLKDPGHG